MSESKADRSSAITALDFDQLFATTGAERFFTEIWEKHPALLDLDRDDFARISHMVGPLEIERLAGLARLGTQAWLSNAYIGHSVFPVDAASARQYFDIGATLYFIDIPLAELTDTIADALGAPRDRIIASLFLTAAESGAEPHFDKNENFTIQLTGEKSWTVADEPTISNPPQGYIVGQPVPAALKRLGMQSRQASPGRQYLLTPGDMLYVPRGTVHSTSAQQESWSLNISYTGLMWVDLITGALHDHLLTKPDWRRSVAGLGGRSNPAAKGRNILPALMSDVRQVLASGDLPEIMDSLLRQSKR